MLIRTPEPDLQEGDILVRPKKSVSGFHYGTVVRAEAVVRGSALLSMYPKFVVAHTLPESGKHIDTIDDFFDGMEGWRIRPERNALERQIVERRAASDLGRPYALLDSCETDITRVQTGVPSNPTATRIGIAAGVVLSLIGLAKAFRA